MINDAAKQAANYAVADEEEDEGRIFLRVLKFIWVPRRIHFILFNICALIVVIINSPNHSNPVNVCQFPDLTRPCCH